MSDFLVKNHLEKDIFPVRKYVDDSWQGFIEIVLQVQPEKLSSRGRWVFRCYHGWLRVSALGQCYNAHPVTLLLNLILFNSRIGSKFGVFCQYSMGQCMPKDFPSTVKNPVNVSFCIVIIVKNLCMFIQKGFNFGGGEVHLGPPEHVCSLSSLRRGVKLTSISEGVQKPERSYIAGGNVVKWCRPLGKLLRGSSEVK